MKSIKKLLLIGCGALAMVALSVPALASATEPIWTDNGAPLKGQGNLSLQGTLAFSSEKGGVECAVSGLAALEANKNTGWLWLGSSIDPKNCKATGWRAFCPVSSVTLSPSIWYFAAAGPSGMGTGTYATVKFGEHPFCPYKEDVYGGGHWMNLDNATGMNYWTPTGSVSSSATGTAQISGKYNLTPAGRYGITTP
jgi:hypothetical protein